jgi:outer membrane protein assembly factor BamE (lipoprotein component of BamABCDE complex)
VVGTDRWLIAIPRWGGYANRQRPLLIPGGASMRRHAVSNCKIRSAGERSPPPSGQRVAFVTTIAVGLVCAAALAGCSPIVAKHGQLLGENDVQQVQRGMSQDQVRMALGTPATTTPVGVGNAYYYISSTTSTTALAGTQEIDRQVIAVYFAANGTVERVANYGLKDGKVFDFISRTTPAADSKEETLLQQMFRNLGKKQIFGDG